MLKQFLTLLFLVFTCIISFAQPGKDGNYTVSAVNTVVNTYSRITSNVTVGSSTVTINSVAADLGGLVTGDLVMIYQAQGATIQTTDDNDYGKILSYNSAGLYEYAYVASVAGNTITIACGVKQSYSAAGRAQVVKVPQYNNLTIPSGRSIIPAKWNGSTGGIVAVHVKGTLTNNGAVSAQRAGFRGGKRDNLSSTAGAGIITTYRSVSPNDGGEKGEGIAGYQTDYEAAGMGGRYSRGAPANGGGGGNGHNAAGGGGSNGNNGETWTGAGVMDPNPLYLAAWQLDPDFVSNGNSLTNSSGGGRGGYTYGANNVDAFSVPLSDPAWGGDYRDPVGGRGGRPLDSQVETRIFFGGGGGAGDGNNNASNDGGDGGGIVYIIAHTINGTGAIGSEGQDGYNTTPNHNDAPGGGGGGGTIIVKAFNFTGQTLNANGGAGGNQLIGGNESEGCGGGGGGGYIAVPTGGSGTCGLTNSYTYIYGTNGTSSSASITEFPPNGGTWGATGQNDVPVSPYFIPYTLTCLIDGDGDGVHDPSSDLDDDNDGIPDVFESYGGVDPSGDHDGDSAPNYADPNFVPYIDSNCDGINDYFDFDLDGVPDFLDLDSDNDGITDCLEAGGNDANKDGIIDGFTDSDGNGLADAIGSGLVPADMDLDGHRTFQDRDSDGDGITDCIEAGGVDANKDGIIDGFSDSDGDGYADSVDPTTDRLALSGTNVSGSTPLSIPDTDGDNRKNYLDIDSDNDGITDNVEAQPTVGYVAPINADTDGDGIANPYDATPVAIVNTDGTDLPDYLDTDSDNDGIPDSIEGNDADSDGNPSPALPVTGDSDGDGLLNAYDGVSGANSTVAGMGGSGSHSPLQDTDGDGLRDWRDTDDDGDCVLTSSTGPAGENTNGNTSWADDFSQGGTPRPNYLFASNTLTVAGADRCGNGTVTLSASSIATGIFRWYDAATGGTLLATTTASSTSNFLTPSISATTTYYVEFDNTICVTPRKAVIATVISSSSTPTTAGASRCDAGSLTLTASSGSAGTFRWYNAAVAGTLLQTNSSASSSEYITPSIASTTTYYVEFDNGTCISARAAVVATITGAATISVTDGATCGNPTATMSASSNTAGTFSWYNASVDGILLHSESGVTISSFTTPSISANTTYYVAFSDGTCTSPRAAVNATITGAIASPSVTNNTICSSGTATVSASHTSAGTFRWYSEASGGTLLQTNTGVSSSSYTTPSIAATTDYYVEYSNGNCASPRVKVTATVVGTSVTGIDASRCGDGSVTLGAVSTVPGTFRWYTAASGGTLQYTSTPNSTTSSYTTGSLSANTVYYVSFTSASPVCGPTTRVPVTATISSSVTVSVTPAGICSPGTVSLGASTGVSGTFRWYSASAGGTPLFTTTASTSSSFTTPFISATTDYYVEFDNGTCVTSPRTPVRASVVAGTDLATTDGSRCGTGSVNLLVSTLTPGTFRWYAAPSGGSSLSTSGANATNHTYSPSVSSTTTYYVSLTTASPACTSERYPVIATVFPAAPDPTPIHGSRCGNGTVVLAASSTETGTIRWYTGGGTLLQTDHTTTLSTYTTPSLTSSATYYAEFSNGGCTSNRVAVVATRNSGTAPAGPAVTAASRCGDGSLTLQASASSAGVFRWWSAASGGTLLQTTAGATTSSFVTPVLSSTTTYYVDFDNGTCLSSTRTVVTATINAYPVTPTVSDASRCGPGTLSLNATSATSGIFRWYDAATGGTLLQTTSGATASVYTTPALSATTTFYVAFSDGSCNSARRAVNAIVNTVPATPVGVAGSHCGSGTVELSADATTAGTFRWYDASTGGNLLSTSTATSSSSFTTPSISANATYYVEFDNGSCVSGRTSVLATILPTPALPGVTDGSRCEAGTIDLGASSAVSGTFRWYTSSSGGALLETDVATTSSVFTTPILNVSTLYYVEFDNGTCASSRVAVTANVHPDPIIADVTPGCSGIAGNGTITIDASVSVGTLEFSIDGTNFQASNSFTGVANGTYTVYARENSTLCSTSESNVVVQCNVPPTVSNKSVTTNEDVPVSGALLDAGDLDTEGTSLTINTTPVVDALHGGIVIGADGSYTYTPDVNFNGTETITFEVCDNGSPLPVSCIDRVLTITVTAVNDAPVAVLDEPTTSEDTPVTFSAIDNDTDVDGTIDASTVDLDPNTTGIQNAFSTTEGNWSVDAAGDVTYTPALNFNGSASITYTVEDNSGATSNQGTITVTVTAVNDAPVAVLDEPTTSEDTPVTFSATDNDTDVDGTIDASTVDLDPNTAGIQNTFSTTEGDWSVDAAGDVTYTPALNFNGSASITYTVEDNSGATSNQGTITVTVTAVNDAPVAVLDEPTTSEDTPVTFSATDNDTDVDGTIDASTVDLDPNTAGIQNAFSTTEGNWSVDAAGDVTYTPALNFNGSASITYTVEDNSGATSNQGTITVAVTAVNDAPVAVLDEPTTNEDTPVTFSATDNDTDVDGTIDASTVDLDPNTTGIQNAFSTTEGNWSVDAAGDVTYTPALNFNGSASITYTVEDNSGATSNQGTITVAVTAVNDAPVAVLDEPTTSEDTPVTFSAIDNDTDVDGTIDASTVDLDPNTTGIQNAFSTTEGNWSVDAAGDVTYTPALNFNGSASITYTVEDNSGATSNQGTITVTVTAVNDAPVAVLDEPTTSEDTPVTFSATDNDTDVDGTIDASTVDLDPNTAGIQNTFSTTEGDWSVDAAGDVTYTPTLNFNGTASVTYTVEDNTATTSSIGMITVTVTAVNDAPVAVLDEPTTNEDTPFSFSVTDNDTDVDGTIDASTVDLDPNTTGIQNTFSTTEGDWSVDAAGDVTYTPALNFNGSASITYTVEDNSGATSNQGTITVTVTAVNDAPVAVMDEPTTNEDTSFSFSVTDNDTDVDGTIDASTVDLDTNTTGIQNTFSTTEGDWSVDAAGDVTYTPTLNFNGSASITYTVEDNSGATSNQGTITVTVIAINDAPVAVLDEPTTSEDTPVTFSATDNDTDVDGTIDASTVDLDPNTTGIQNTFSTIEGDWSVDSAGDVTYTPTLNFNGSASITYTVEDNSGATSSIGTITVTVTAVNDAPVAVLDEPTTNEDTQFSFNVTDNDTDVDGTIDASTVDLNPNTTGIQNTFSTTEGDWSVDAAGDVTYTPTLNFNGSASITYTVEDNSGATSSIGTITVTVTAVNDAPVAVLDGPVTSEDTPVTFTATDNDTDVDGTIDVSTVDLDPNTTGIQNTFSTTEGDWSVDAAGDVTYTPTLNFNGTASVTYTVEDNSGATSSIGTIIVTVTAVNDAPIAVLDEPTTNEDTPVTFSATDNDTDVDGTINASTVDLDPNTTGIQNTFSTTEGDWAVDAAGDVTYTPALNFNGSASITYTVEDNSGATSNQGTITVTVTALNDAPVAVLDEPTTNEDTPFSFSVTDNDTDVDGTIDASTVDLDPNTIGIQNAFSTTEGTWSVDAAGDVTYTPTLNFNGSASIAYTVEDNSGATSNQGTITVTVTPVNDAPVAVLDGPVTSEDTPVTFTATDNDTDVDGTIDVSTVDLDPNTTGIQNTFSTTEGDWSVDAAGDVTYTPTLNFNGSASITYTVEDNSGATSSIGTITVTVTAVNDAPVAVLDEPTTNEDTPVTFSASDNDTDVDGTIDASTVDLDPNTAGIQNTFSTTEGDWSVDAAGDVTYTPTLNFNGSASITYTVEDNSGATSSIGTIIVTVTAVNDAPVAVLDEPTTSEDTPVTFSVTDNDTDVDGTIDVSTVDLDPNTTGIQNTFSTTEGDWSVDAAGDVTYTPTLNFNGSASITYTVEDNSGATSNQGTITVTVTAVNDAPVAVLDEQTTSEDTPVTFSATDNDTDVDGTIDASTVDLDPNTTGIQNTFSTTEGNWSVDAAGDVTYTPALNFNGSASITYTVEDNSGATSNQGTITVTVIAVNDAPVAVLDEPTTSEDTPVTFSATDNDTDVDGSINASAVDLDPNTTGIQNTFSTTEGDWSVDAAGDVTYTPTLNFNGSASITYTVEDNSGATSSVGTITVTVTAVNDAPVAVLDEPTTSEDAPVTFSATDNDTDVDGIIDASTVDLDPNTTGIQNTFSTTEGDWSVDAAGDVSYTPTLNFNGSASITYTVEDNSGATSNQGTITVTVTAVNDAPVAVFDEPTTSEDTPVTFSVTDNDTDVDGTIDASTVDLDPNTTGIQNTFSTTEGDWSVDAAGDVTYTPTLHFNGSASITYTVEDNSGATSSIGTITVTVTAVNDAPVAVLDEPTTSEDTPLIFNVTSNDTDVDGTVDPVTVDLDTSVSGIQNSFTGLNGTWSVDALGSITFTPNLNFNGVESISYTVNDNDGATSDPGNISITVVDVNDPPVAVADNFSLNEDTPLTFDPLANDSDVDGTLDASSLDLDPTTTTVEHAITNTEGTWSVDASGEITFVPVLNFNGNTTINYVVRDDDGDVSEVMAIDLTVAPVNDAPVLQDNTVTTTQGLQASGNIINAGDYDPDGTPLVVSTIPVTAPAHGTVVIHADGSYQYVSDPDFTGTDVIVMQVCDGGLPLPASCVTTTLFVKVVTNQPPVVSDKKPLATEDIRFDGKAIGPGDHDPEGLDLVVSTSPVQAPAHGVVIINPDGTYAYTPDEHYYGTDLFKIEVCDTNPAPACSVVEITIEVGPVNDPPVITDDVAQGLINGTATGNILANDTDPDNTALVVNMIPVSGPSHGSIVMDASGIYTYTPDHNFAGTDEVVFEVCDDGTPAICGTNKITITVTDPHAGEVFIPEGFSPNGDGVNDYFVIGYTGDKKIHLEIYNRWGNLVYKHENYQNDWNGDSRYGLVVGSEVPDGTYFYKVQVGKIQKVKSFTIQR